MVPKEKISAGSLFSKSLAGQPPILILTLIEFTAQFVVGAPFHHLSDMFSLLVNRHGTDDSALRRWGHHLDLDGTCLCNLAVEFLQFGGILLRDGPVVAGRKEPTGDTVTFQIRIRTTCPLRIDACLRLAITYTTVSNLIRRSYIH